MTSTIQEQIAAAQQQIEALKKKLDTLQTLEELIRLPGGRETILEALGESRRGRMEGSRIQVSGGVTAFSRLKEWFQDRSNRPASISEMSAAVNVSESAIRQIVYRTRAGSFDKSRASGSRESLFCLKQATGT